MTNLRDDGYLETDNPVVVACFIGRAVKARMFESEPDSTNPITIDKVGSDFVFSDELAYEPGDDCYYYPILIPATVVAEVFFTSELAMKVIVMAIDNEDTRLPTYEVVRWLTQHTGRKDDPKTT